MVSKTAIIVLAAGESARMGTPKQLLPIRDTRLLNYCMRAFREVKVDTVVLVLGAMGSQIQDQLEDTDVTVVHNENWAKGMGGSLAIGLKCALDEHPQLDQVLISLGDLPLLDEAHYKMLLEAARVQTQAIVATRYATTGGVPVLFKRIYFDRLLTLDGEMGAKKLLTQYADDVFWVEAEQPYADVDTPEDYQQILRTLDHHS